MAKKKARTKNPGVGIDFKRAKHKVGKKLPRAQNDTNVDFKARAINLPSQTVREDRTGTAVNYQNLTLKVRVLCGGAGLRGRGSSVDNNRDLVERETESEMGGGRHFTSSRRLNPHPRLQELLSQTTHHNDKSRKHSLAGLGDLFGRHPEQLRLNAVQVRRACVRGRLRPARGT